MKAILTVLFLGTCTITTFAQTLPNSSFEDWHTTMGELEPDYWSISPEVLLLGGNPMAERSTDAHSGNYSAKIVTLVVSVLGNETTSRGVLYNETGLPLAGRPDSVVVWLKYLPDGDHEYAIRADLTAWDAQQQTTIPVALATYVGGLTPNYTRVSFPFSYSSGVQPDSVIFTVYNDYFDEVFGLNTALWIDDISLIYPEELATQESLFSQSTLYPNPADQSFHVELPQAATWAIYDTEGRICLTESDEFTTTFTVATSALNNGIYYLKTSDGNCLKFMVQHE